MYPVTQDLIEKLRADVRRTFARVAIDYTDPHLDQSIVITANEKANVSYPEQTADSVDVTPYKWACLDGTWNLSSGEWHLAPTPDKLSQYQFGWWGAQLAEFGGVFLAPYPALTVTHLPRPIFLLKVVGDAARQEYPVDFTIELFDEYDALLYTETVVGNDQVFWMKSLSTSVLDVAKQVLTITKWSHEGRCAKIVEFFTSIREVYEDKDLMSIKLLEEREAAHGSLPVGNISSNEITIALNNESKKFDVDNEQSPLKNMLKPNRKIQTWIGADAENAAAAVVPTFTRSSPAYLSDGTQVAANQPRFEQGKFGKAITVEEGTTNLIPSQPASVEEDAPTGWENVGGTVHERTTDDAWHGQASIRATNTGESGTSWLTRHVGISSPPVGTLYTASAYVKGVPGTSASIGIGFAGGSAPTSWQYAPDLTTMNGQWQVVTITRAVDQPDRTRATVSLSMRTAGATYYWDAIQLEAKPYPTSFTDGTRSPEALTIPTAGVLNPQEGTVECWVYVNDIIKRLNPSGSYGKRIFHISGGVFVNGLMLYHDLNAANWVLASFNDAGEASTIRISDTITPNGWHMFSAAWNSQELKLLIDGQNVGNAPNPKLPTSFAPNMYIGSRDGVIAEAFANTLIDDLRISNRARTDEEILAAYQSNKPLHRDEHTTYLLSFNGSIYPVEQCWVPLGTFWSLDWDSPDDTIEATVTARDRMELLRKGTYQSAQVQQNKRLYELAEAVLQDAGLKSDEYIIDEALQDIIVPYAWFSPVSHREALRQIAEAGLAVAFQNREGKIQIESYLFGESEPALEISADDYFSPLRTPSRQEEVANEIIVDTQPLRPADEAEEVYRSNEPITIPAGSTKTIMAYYNVTPVIDAVASLVGAPAEVSIIDATYYGWGATVKIQNTKETDSQVVLVINGKPMTIQNKERAIARDELSILENGVLRYEFPSNHLVQTLTQAQAIAYALLASVKDPRRDIEVNWRGNPALLLGDKVRIKNNDYHVIRQEITWDGALSARLTGRKA